MFTDPIQTLVEAAFRFLPGLIVALVVFAASLFVAGLAAKTIRRFAEARKVDPELALLLSRSGRWVVVTLGTILALEQVNFDVTAFVAGLGIAGFTLGFALQDVTQNFVAGVLLLLQQPFDLGDAIAVGDYAGTVTDISLRTTELRTFDGLQVLIPNADVYTSPVINYSKATRRRLALDLGVAYGTDLERATRVALEAIAQVAGVMDDPPPTVVFSQFAESSIDFTLYYWFDTSQTSLFAVQDRGLKAINLAFQRAQIDIPFPVRTVYLHQAG